MKDTVDRLERLESLKAGTIAALSLFLTFASTTLVHSQLLAKSSTAFGSMGILVINWQWFTSGAIAAICGLLFGVTYRYTRRDGNFQLKTGAVLAFGLVRGLTQVDIGLHTLGTVLPLVVMAGESVLWFAIAAIALESAIHLGWLKPFSSD